MRVTHPQADSLHAVGQVRRGAEVGEEVVDHGGGVFAVFEVFAVADVVEQGGEGHGSEVELGAEEVRGMGVDIFGEPYDSLDVFKVVGGVVLGHVLLDKLNDGDEEGVAVEGSVDGHDEE